jgi:urea transporter
MNVDLFNERTLNVDFLKEFGCINIGNWKLALYGLLGTCVSMLTAHVLGFIYNSSRSGLYGYN